MNDKRKVLFLSDNLHLNTGSARVCRKLVDFVKEDNDLIYYATNSPGFRRYDINIPIVDDGHDDYGRTQLPNVIANEKPDVVITFGDVMHYSYIPYIPNRKNFLWIFFVMIDSLNFLNSLPSSWQPILSNADSLITCTEFAQNALEEFLETNVTCLRFGCSEKFFRVTEEEQLDIRSEYGLKDKFVVLVVNRNALRKNIPASLKAFKKFRETFTSTSHFDEPVLFLHMNSRDPFGIDINSLLRDYELLDCAYYINSYFNSDKIDPDIPDDKLREIYNLSSYGKGCFLYTSGAEGYGLTMLEAMSCGVPVIACDYSSMTEILGNCGFLIKPSSYLTVEAGLEHALIDEDEVVKKLELLSKNEYEAIKMSNKSVERSKLFNWTRTEGVFSDIIDNIEMKSNLAIFEKYNDFNPKVDLIVEDGTEYEDNTYFLINKIWEFDKFGLTEIDEVINECESDYVAVLMSGVIPQRGWLSELVKLVGSLVGNSGKVAIASSICIGNNGRVAVGEVKLGNNLMYILDEESEPLKHDREVNTIIFSAVLIDCNIYKELGGFNEKLYDSFFDLEYCMRIRESSFIAVQACRSFVLRRIPYDMTIPDMLKFREATEVRLNKMVKVIYKGMRQKIYADGKFFKRNTSVSIPYRRAVELVTSYLHIQFDDEQSESVELKKALDMDGKFLIARNGGLGDAISAAYFAAKPLKDANPNIKLTFVTDSNYTTLINSFNFIDEVQTYPQGLTLFDDYDFHKDLSYLPETLDPKSESIRSEIFAEYLGDYANYLYEPYEPPLEFLGEALSTFDKLGISKERTSVGIQCFCSSPVRVYPPEYLTILVQLLIENNFDVILFGVDKYWKWGVEQWTGKNLFSFVNAVDDLRMVAAMMRLCDYFIAPDSGLMHLAGVMNIKTLALFGNIEPECRIKYYSTMQSLFPKGELPCITCGDIYNPCPECSNLGQSNNNFSGMCMRLLYPERVLDAFLEMVGIDINDKINIGNEVITCPLCGGNELEEINRINFWDGHEIPEVIYVKCIRDGLVFSSPQFDAIKYEKNYFQSGDPNLFYEDILAKDFDGPAERVKTEFSIARGMMINEITRRS